MRIKGPAEILTGRGKKNEKEKRWEWELEKPVIIYYGLDRQEMDNPWDLKIPGYDGICISAERP